MTDIKNLECKELVFHFNKASIADPTIPPWVIKTKGQTYGIWHLEADAPFSTRETPNHPSTKGSVKFRHVTLDIDSKGHATIGPQHLPEFEDDFGLR